MGHVIDLDGRRFLDRGESWPKAGKVAFGVGFVLFVAGYLAAFSVVGAVLWFAGAIIGVGGLVTWLAQYRWAWVPLGSLVLLLSLFIVQVLE